MTPQFSQTYFKAGYGQLVAQLTENLGLVNQEHPACITAEEPLFYPRCAFQYVGVSDGLAGICGPLKEKAVGNQRLASCSAR